MSKNIEHVQHLKSKMVVDGSPKLPNPSALTEGEIVINYAEGYETISIKNSSGDVVTFSSDNYFISKNGGFKRVANPTADTNVGLVNSLLPENSYNTNIGKYSVIEGYSCSAVADYSHAEGYGCSVSGINSHAEGTNTHAIGPGGSHAEGQNTTASGGSSHAEGAGTFSIGDYSHAEGSGTQAIGNYSHVEGYYTSAITEGSHAEGNQTIASGNSSHAEGLGTKAGGYYSHAEGYKTTGHGYYSHSEGQETIASGRSSHAEGENTLANGFGSHAEGHNTSAMTDYTHAEGGNTTAKGYASHAEGSYTLSRADYSHAEGSSTSATGIYSHAEGFRTVASGDAAHAEGFYTKTSNIAEHASGQYNTSSRVTVTFGNSGNTLFSIGNGTADDARHNAFEIRQNGDIYIVNKDGNDVKLQDEISNITVDQVLDNTTSASTNPVSSKAVYSAITDNELVWTNAYVALSGVVSSHTEDTTVHLTSTEKEQLHTHSNKSALDAITGNVGTAAYKGISNGITNSDNLIEAKHIYSGVGVTIAYDSNSKYIQLKNTSGSVISSFDAQSFVVDGMIESVSAGTSGSTTVLDIKWNTDAGSQETILDIGDMFEADNYYTTAQTSGATELSTAFGGKLSTSDFNAYSGAVDTTIGSKAAQSDLNTLSGTVTGHTADTNIHLTTTEKTNLDSLATNIAAISGITSTKVGNWDSAYEKTSGITATTAAINSLTGSVGSMAFQNTNTYSSATEVNTALAGKSNTGHTHSISDVTNLQTTLNGKANTATTLSGYGITNAYTKTEIDTMIGDIETLLAAI